jgi:hypothetical protein
MASGIADLKQLQNKADALRKSLGISRPGEITFLAARDGSDDEVVVVVADGVGGATTRIVIGNYPLDYNVEFEKAFSTERSAEAAAEKLACSSAPLNGI